MAAITICSDFGAPKNKVWHCFHCLPSISHEVMGPDAMILLFWMLSFKPTLSVSSFTFIKRFFSSSSLSAIRVVSSAYLLLPYLKHFMAFHHSKVRNQNPLNGPQNFVWPGPCCVPHHLTTLTLPAMTLLSIFWGILFLPTITHLSSVWKTTRLRQSCEWSYFAVGKKL